MKILVFSDSHGDLESLICATKREADAAVVLHLGDGNKEFLELKNLFPEKTFYGVKGNNDWESLDSISLRLNYSGHLIFLTHGQNFGVKQGLNQLATEGKKIGAEIVLYGHTHQPNVQEIAGIKLMNPGSINDRSANAGYGIIEILDSTVKLKLVPLTMGE